MKLKYFILVSVMLLSLNLLSASLCYQETATTSTSCGGLSTGSYTCTGDWTTSPCSQAYDSNWGTWATPDILNGGRGYIYINYTKPNGLIQNSSIWQVKDSTSMLNLSINGSCWNYSSTRLSLRVESNVQGTGGGRPAPCLNEYTKISMAIGEKNIKDIKIGDYVISYNPLNLIEYDKVINVFSRDISLAGNKYYYIYTNDNLIKATNNHEFYSNGEYIRAENLKIDDVLLDKNLQKKTITKINIVNNYEDKVWDLTIEKNHDFFANDILVHNDLGANFGGEWTCFNGTAWQSLKIGGSAIFEEAMNWNVTIPSCWTKTGNVLYIQKGCVYNITRGALG